jgi:hypothetical protein
MAARRWYSQVLIVAVVVISAGAAFSIPSIRGWHIWGPLAKRQAPVAAKPARPSRPVVQQQATPVPPTVNSGEVSVAPKAPAKPATKAAPKWVPSERQRLRDAVYLAGKDNRPADAIAALEAWDAKHPGDAEVLRELARLLARTADRRGLRALPRAVGRFAEYRERLMCRRALALQQYDSAAVITEF